MKSVDLFFGRKQQRLKNPIDYHIGTSVGSKFRSLHLTSVGIHVLLELR